MTFSVQRADRSVRGPVQSTIFDAMAAVKARNIGMELAAGKKGALLAFAREGAKRVALARVSREVTADDVQQYLVDNDLDEGCLGNAAGSVFKDRKVWQYVRHEKSKRQIAHARVIAVWRYVGSEPSAVSGQQSERPYEPSIPPEGNHLSGVGIQTASSGFDYLKD